GVMKVVKNHFTDVFDKYNIDRAVVNSTCYYNDMLFIGKDSGLTVVNTSGNVDRLNLNEVKTASGEHLGYLDLISMLEKVKIRSIIKDSKDRLWISTFGDLGLVRYDNGNVVTFEKEEGLPESQRIRTVYECRDGSYLVACTGGVAVIRDDKVEKVYGTESGVSNIEILTVAEGSDGEIIAGSDGDGIYIIGDSGIKHINTDNGLMSDVVMRIKKSQYKDVYWIVTSNSIAYMTSDYEVHTIKDFPYSNNFDMYEDSQGDVWVLSSNGIYVISADALIENQNISPVFYGIDNGLPIIANANSYSCVTDDGILYVAGTTGVAKVNIESVFEDVNDVKMTVPYVEADGVKFYPDSEGKIVVPSSVKKITIYPYVCSYNLMNPKVTYKLEGFGSYESTVKRSELSSIDYTNLKGGTYAFRMTLADSMGHSSNEDVFSIVIVKQKAFYEYFWFMILTLLMGISLIALIFFLYVRRKTKALLKKQEENKTLIREIVEAFAKTIDMKDKYTNGHSKRVADYTVLLARELGYDEETVEKYYNIALLHDIGKIGVPGEVLNKEGRLTDDEYHTIQSHTVLGYNVLKDISIMPELSVGAESHHERPDGKGYPQGLKEDEIPRVAQIIAVADAFDAMYSNRPYRNRMNFEKVVSIISGARGTQMTADVVDAFLRIVERGGFRAPDDIGGGTTEDIDNIHKRLEKESKDQAKEQPKDREDK
ncbi:MAG: HD domain-containing protein, partial [Clostridiales bacterium]|nr:HD domain-containing protein [Clostridiales bacterium]